MARGFDEGKVQGSTWEDDSHTTQQHQQVSHSNQDRLRQAALKRIGQEFSPGHRPHGRPDMMRTHDGSPSWRDKRPSSMTLEHGGDGMQMASFSPTQIANMRRQQHNHAVHIERAIQMAHTRFQQVLLKREITGSAPHTLQKIAAKEISGWLIKQLGSVAANSMKVAKPIEDILTAETTSVQNSARMGAIEVINGTMLSYVKSLQIVGDNISNASDQEILQNQIDGLGRAITINDAEINNLVARLDSLLLYLINESGTLTVNEYFDKLSTRKADLPGEIDHAEKVTGSVR